MFLIVKIILVAAIAGVIVDIVRQVKPERKNNSNEDEQS